MDQLSSSEKTAPESKIPAKLRRTISALFGVGGMFLALGIGNLVFGTMKQDEYTSLLSAATAELATPEATTQSQAVPPITPTVAVDEQTQYVDRLTARIQFYELVTIGGKAFMAFAVVFLLSALFISRMIAADRGIT